MSEKSSSSGKGRTRNYATIVYPESAPENWVDLLRDQKVNAFISPLHDKDINPGGEEKKSHYHVQFLFESVKSKDQVQEIVSKIGGVGVEVVNSLRGYARYLCHLDNPEKAQYNVNDVISIGAEDYQSIISLPTDKYKLISEMIDYCRANNVVYFNDLFDYAMEEREDWFRCLCDNGTYVMKEYLKSMAYKAKS